MTIVYYYDVRKLLEYFSFGDVDFNLWGAGVMLLVSIFPSAEIFSSWQVNVALHLHLDTTIKVSKFLGAWKW